MEIENTSLLKVFPFPQIDKNGAERIVVLAKGRFDIVPNGRCIPAAGQPEIDFVDAYYGDPKESSLRTSSDLVYCKPCTDIYFLDPIALARGGEPAPSWSLDVRVGNLIFNAHVFGNRKWYRSHTGSWKLNDPVPSHNIPIRFESSYGGKSDDFSCRENPVGRGLYLKRQLEESEELDAPQLAASKEDFFLPGTELCGKPLGLTPVSPAWLPRLNCAGVFDAQWLRETWPRWPADFDEAFFNSAPRDLQYSGFLAGDEEVCLEGFSERGALNFQLPCLGRVELLTFFTGAKSNAQVLKIDTVVFDLPKMAVQITWRTSLVPPSTPFYSQLAIKS